MGKYMTVVLLPEYKKETIINKINKDLCTFFAANEQSLFCTFKDLRTELTYLNEDQEGLQQVPDWPRPITAKLLQEHAFWVRVGEFSFKLSYCEETKTAREAIAICKWIIATEAKYINARLSNNYDQQTLQEYLDHLFISEGYELSQLWNQPLIAKSQFLHT